MSRHLTGAGLAIEQQAMEQAIWAEHGTCNLDGKQPPVPILLLLRRTAQVAGRICSALCCAWNGVAACTRGFGSRCGLLSM